MKNNRQIKKISLQSLLSNNKILLVVSFVLAFAVWLAISLNEAPEIERVVENVKVTIDDSVPSQLGYETFGIDDVYVDITVKGKRYLVGDNVLGADDFTVTAVTSHVDAPGNYSLQLKATAKDPNANYQIVSKSMDNIDVYFDTKKTAELTVEPRITCENDKLLYSEDYSTDDPILSVEKIKVTGPATEIGKIRHALATVVTKGKLKETETLTAELSIVDAYGAKIKYISVDTGEKDVTITIPVYKTVELPVTVDFSNIPTYYIDNPPHILCSPEKIKIAVDTNKLGTLQEISLGTVDFGTLKTGINTVEMDTSKIKDGKPVNDSATFKVYITVNEQKTTT